MHIFVKIQILMPSLRPLELESWQIYQISFFPFEEVSGEFQKVHQLREPVG